MSNEAFVTLATNDTYGLGALVLGRSLRRVATSKQTVVLVTADVSQKMKEELGHVFNLVVTVDTLDSGDAAHLALMSRPELGITFTKLHAWRLVQFSKCVFLDADTLVVQNCDELFEREELSAAPDPGWPDCFNSGVFVFVPSEATFKALMDFAVAHGSFDGGDQGLLNMFFSDWATGDIRKHLPFIYNVVSSATYSYLPALKHFGSQVKIAHFLGSNKPWLRQGQAGSSSPYQRAWWSIFREDVAGRLSQDMAGIPGVLARGEPDDWRREAWEAGDVDYLGQDSFDNIWKRICECVGITAQTLSAPAAPAATSAGIVKQPSALAPVSEKTVTTTTEKVSEAAPAEKLSSPLIEKPAGSDATTQKQTVTDLSAEKQAGPTSSLEKPMEIPITEKKSVETVESVEKPAEPPVAAEKAAAPPAAAEKPTSPTFSAEKPVEPVVSAEKPAVLTEKPAETVVSPDKQAESVVHAEKPAEPLVPAEKPAAPAVPTAKTAETVVLPEKPLETAVSSDKQTVPVVTAGKQSEPPVPAEKPAAPAASSEQPAPPLVPTEKPAAPAVLSEQPAAPPVPAEKPAAPAVPAEKPAAPAVPSEQPAAPVVSSEKPVAPPVPEALPVPIESQTVVNKEIKVEATSDGKPAQKTADPTPSEKKSAKQGAQSVEKPTETSEAIAVSSAKTANADKLKISSDKSSKQAEAVPTEKKTPESVPALEKSLEMVPAVEKPVEKSAEFKSETVKQTGTVEATEVCPMKPSVPKSTPPGTPADIAQHPISSEPSLKSGEARIQPPLVGGEAPVCKKEPGTPTVTPPSGPGSPQPADVPPEVCKLQATPSQPATPPASSHQTTDAPVPPKRKQGKNGKGKGKK